MSSAALGMVTGSAASAGAAAVQAPIPPQPSSPVGATGSQASRATRVATSQPQASADGQGAPQGGTPSFDYRPPAQAWGAAATLFLAQTLGQSQPEAPLSGWGAAAAYDARSNSGQDSAPAMDIVLPFRLLSSGRAVDITV